MAGEIIMGEKDLKRAKVMEMVVREKISLQQAKQILRVSYRQVKRIKAKYLKSGDAGMVHGNRGKRSHNSYPKEFRETAVFRYQERYFDFGPTFACEKLMEEGTEVNHETLRRWLLEEGIWKRKRRSGGYYQRRERKESFGELVQFDGSHHDWFEGRGPKCCLMNMVDDATCITHSILTEEETSEAAMKVLWEWIERYGVPEKLYCDRKNAFLIDREPTIEEQLKGIIPKTPFQIACDKLGIEIITAYSPQAKGRVERNHAVYQDRFVKELRLREISTMTEANKFLQERYLEMINTKFAKPSISGEDRHVALQAGQDLSNILCFEDERVVSRDFVIRYRNRLFQITKENKQKPKTETKVVVHRWLDGTIHVFWKNNELLVEEITVEQFAQRFQKKAC